MNVVLVQHKPKQIRKFCFAVPDNLLPHVKQGSSVICDTRRGRTHGLVVSEVLTGETAERAIAENHATMPLRNIAAVVNFISISDICVPIYMEVSKPNPDKINKRRQELRDLGYVRTKVRVDDNGILRDGYTAYLACKDVGMAVIPVAIAAHPYNSSQHPEDTDPLGVTYSYA